MNRIATRLGLLLLYGIIAGGAASACASEDSSLRTVDQNQGKGGAAGTAGTAGTGERACNPMYCPQNPAAKACCVTAMNSCGFDFGTGCMVFGGNKDGGH